MGIDQVAEAWRACGVYCTCPKGRCNAAEDVLRRAAKHEETTRRRQQPSASSVSEMARWESGL